MPVILAIWEVEIRKIRGSRPTWANSFQEPTSKKPEQNGVEVWFKWRAPVL
jgi:hypothetical protein